MKGGFHKGKLLMVSVINHTDKEAHDTGLVPPRASPFYQLSPIETHQCDLQEALLPSWAVYSPVHGVLRWFPFSLCASSGHILMQSNLWKINFFFFVFHSKVKEYPNNLALPEI